MVGVRVTRGCLPGAMTLYGPSSARVTKLCARWLSPTPVRPAITAGTQPPLGVIDTTHPASSAASIDVVPAWNCAENAESDRIEELCVAGRSCWPLGCTVSGAGTTLQRASRSAKGLVPPWYG